jgi:hypothetical protein
MTSFEITSSAFKGDFQMNVSPARLVITTTGATPTHEDEAKLVGFLTKILHAGVEFVALYDLRVLGMPSLSLLRGLGEWLKKHEKKFQPLNLAIAIILKDSLWSGAVKRLIGIVTAICPPVCPLQITYSMDSVEDFFFEHSSFIEPEAMVKVVSRFTSLESCEFTCEEEPSFPQALGGMPDFSLLKQKFSFSARSGTSAESTPVAVFADVVRRISSSDFAECMCESNASDGHGSSQNQNCCKLSSESGLRSTRASFKNKHRVRKFVTKSR